MNRIKKMTAAAAALCIALTMFGCGKEVEKKAEEPAVTTTQKVHTPDEGVVNPGYGELSDFSAQTISGNTVDQGIFADHDLTMVYIWQTDKDHCKEELPAIQKLSTQLPDGAALIGMCADGEENADEAKKIIDEAGITFENIIGTATLADIKTTPTAVYIDKNGNVVGDVSEGHSMADGEDAVVQDYLMKINSHMGMARTKYAADEAE